MKSLSRFRSRSLVCLGVLVGLLLVGWVLVQSRAADSAEKSEAEKPAAEKPAVSGKSKPKKGKSMVAVQVFDKSGKLVGPIEVAKLELSDAEWKKRLTPEQYKIARHKGTEQAFCGTLLDNKLHGIYTCVGCGLPLFSSEHKFDSGTGWPSFFQPVGKENVAEKVDKSHGMVRKEINCARCSAHLGHVFDDGPQPTRLRFCLNSESLKFTKDDNLASLADPAAEQQADK